jgi:hypothetical protein
MLNITNVTLYGTYFNDTQQRWERKKYEYQ